MDGLLWKHTCQLSLSYRLESTRRPFKLIQISRIHNAASLPFPVLMFSTLADPTWNQLSFPLWTWKHYFVLFQSGSPILCSTVLFHRLTWWVLWDHWMKLQKYNWTMWSLLSTEALPHTKDFWNGSSLIFYCFWLIVQLSQKRSIKSVQNASWIWAVLAIWQFV